MSSPSDFIVKGEQVIATSQRTNKQTNKQNISHFYETKRGMSKMAHAPWFVISRDARQILWLLCVVCLFVCLFYIGIALVSIYLLFFFKLHFAVG